MAQQVETTWLDVLQSHQPVLVDFYADWCGPCRQQLKVVDALAEEFKTLKANIDNEPELVDAYRVSALPTLLIFRDGEVVDRLIGYHDGDTLREALERAAAGVGS